MKIPKKLKVGGHIYKVILSSDLGENTDGDHDTETNKIRIRKTLPKSQKEVTFFHEVFHALNSEITNLSLGHVVLESLAQQMYQVLKDNNMLK